MRNTIVAAVCLHSVIAWSASASGVLRPRSGEPPIHVRSHRVQATLEDGIARTTVRQTFVNPHGRALEAIYVFPLPEGAALTAVSMVVDGKRLEGLLAERKQARRVYNDIVRSKRDPALVEQIGRNTFRLSVYPVMPGVDTIVELTYLERVPLERGAFRYVYPLATGVTATKTKEDFTLTVDVRSSIPLAEVTTSETDAHASRRSDSAAHVSIERNGALLQRDVVVVARIAEQRPKLVLRTTPDPRGGGWFQLLVTPPSVAGTDVVARDVILVIDRSGSMSGEKIEQAKRSANYLLAGLRPKDRVNVLAFSSDVEPFAEEPVAVTPENLARLRAFVDRIDAGGGTALADALAKSLDVPDVEGRVRTVVFLTDGRPTVGESEPDTIVRIARAGRSGGLRVFPFGIGANVHGALLEAIATATRGRAELFRPSGEIEGRLRRFLDRTSTPVLANLAVDVPGAFDVFPRPMPDLHLGEQIAIVGRYKGEAPGNATVTARNANTETTMTVVGGEPCSSGAVRDLFARMKLDYLEGQRRLRSGLADDAYYAALDRGAYSTSDEIVDEIVSVSLDYGIQSAFASFIVLLPEDRARIDPRDHAAMKKALDRVRAVRGDKAPRVAESADGVMSDRPYEGKQSNAAIGLGGGAFGGRRGGRRGRMKRYGGQGTASAVDQGLEWLSSHQVPDDGQWSKGSATVEDTGLALLALLGAGYTHQAGKYKKTIADAINYLRRTQRPDGRFAEDVRQHAIATLAVAEAYGMTTSPVLKRLAEGGVSVLAALVTPPESAVDRAWIALALKSAKTAGMTVDTAVIDRVLGWLTAATPTDETDRAALLLARLMLGTPEKSAVLKACEPVLAAALRHGSATPSTGDAGFWYFSALAMFQVGGSHWKQTNKQMKAALVGTQQRAGKERGSWTGTLRASPARSAVATTALCTMCLGVYYRYGKVFGTK